MTIQAALTHRHPPIHPNKAIVMAATAAGEDKLALVGMRGSSSSLAAAPAGAGIDDAGM